MPSQNNFWSKILSHSGKPSHSAAQPNTPNLAECLLEALANAVPNHAAGQGLQALTAEFKASAAWLYGVMDTSSTRLTLQELAGEQAAQTNGNDASYPLGG